MTTEARRAELIRELRKIVPSVMPVNAERAMAEAADMLARYAEAEARGFAAGRAAALADAADRITVAALWNYGPSVGSYVTQVRHLIWGLARAEAKKGGAG